MKANYGLVCASAYLMIHLIYDYVLYKGGLQKHLMITDTNITIFCSEYVV